ncbi:MAG: peptide ABC transporter substrate-binding protein [Tissierellia bacterium]|nr:peptide ABC transporter substrate-binding protein [Tissierellia bacterium]
MRYNADNELVPAVAESYEVSEDGLTWTFHLKDDVVWSNGDPITANDFVYAWNRVLDPELASEYSFQLTTYVVGAEEALAGTGAIEDVGYKAIDDKTLEVQLKTPTPYFAGLSAFYTLYPVHQASVEGNAEWANDPANTPIVSNGPFTITAWDHGTHISLVKNDKYWDAENVKLAGIDFTILEDANTAYTKYQGNEFDVLTNPPTAVVAQSIQGEDPELKMGPKVGTYYFEMNTAKSPFSNVKVRQALSMAIDRKTIVENITMGGQQVAEGMVPPGLLDDTGAEFRTANGNLIKEDVEEAKKLLEEGLAEEGLTVADMNNFVLSYNTDEGHKKIAQAVQEMWRQNLGFEIGLENMEFQILLDKRNAGDYDIARAGWIGDYADPNTMMDLFMTDNPQNDSSYNSEEYDTLMKTAASTNDAKVRMDSMKEAEKILMNDLPIVPVYFYTAPRMEKPYVSGVFNNPLSEPEYTYANLDQQ